MGKFLESEKTRVTDFKQHSSSFSTAGRQDGVYRGKPRPFCVPRELSRENLFAEIRDTAVSYFTQNDVKWHDAINRQPSNHLCDSQVCCVNFLDPFADKPEALAELLRPHFPTIRAMLPMEQPGRYVSFEWIGAQNYLGESKHRRGKRTRGANYTSADAAVMFEQQDGSKQIVLIEWKYTESYSPHSKLSGKGAIRREIYRHLFEDEGCPINKEILPDYDALFYEPFYQLFRQQLMAHEMEKAGELGAKQVSLLHLCPEVNVDFRRVTSPMLASIGSSATSVWSQLVLNAEERFKSMSVEELFNGLDISQQPELAPWKQYINARYSWMAHT